MRDEKEIKRIKETQPPVAAVKDVIMLKIMEQTQLKMIEELENEFERIGIEELIQGEKAQQAISKCEEKIDEAVEALMDTIDTNKIAALLRLENDT